MKLYTEEQIREAFRKGYLYAQNFVESESDFINSLTPIELPSDEEIKKEALNYITYSGFTGFTTCVVWLRDKIIKRNDNQQFK